jgi:hypothetical protein
MRDEYVNPFVEVLTKAKALRAHNSEVHTKEEAYRKDRQSASAKEALSSPNKRSLRPLARSS